MSAQPTLFFVRHGETDWNAVARLQGQQDIPLNRTGEKQAVRCGEILKSLIGARLDMPFISSPMLRTIATMRLMREAAGLPADGYAIDDRLKEISFGRWEGLTWKEVRRSDPGEAAGREADKWGFVPPGGESYQMLTDRIAIWLETVSEDSVIVAHGGVARALLVLIGGESTVDAPKAEIRQGRILLFENGGHRWVG
ncbi:MAG: histidine phosphatase family protein [Beijerinckiaceae bacterium]|nr:histidine phosphatase family protein [Beijerinckiaceae bacterium]